jgi:hypothetical protein
MKINFLKAFSLYILIYALIHLARLLTWREREDLGLYIDYWSDWPPTMKVSIILGWILLALTPILSGATFYLILKGKVKRAFFTSLSLLSYYIFFRTYTLYSDLTIYPPSGGIVGKNLSEATIGWRLSPVGHLSQTLLLISMFSLVAMTFVHRAQEKIFDTPSVEMHQESLSLELGRLGKLFDAGLISQNEFKAAKKKLLE